MTDLEQARADLAQLEAKLPPGAHLWEPFTRLFNAIAAIKGRIKLLEAKQLPVTAA